MKVLHGLIAVLLWCGPVGSTVLTVGTIEQPINLGPKSDPGRIPLGPVAVESNHDYGVHMVISEPRPCTHGAIAWEKGLELNMNLASAFGIEVIPEDGTLVPKAPVTINVKDWPVPAYSPYRKEQVLAATLHCLLRSVHAPPATPLKIVINAANPEDARNLGGFAGTYLTAEAEDHGGPTPVPGTRLETDWRGVTYVIFTDRDPAGTPAANRPPPVLIPFHIPDDTDDLSYDLIPVWAGDTWKEERRKILSQPVTLYYDRYDKTQSNGPDINALTRLGLISLSEWRDVVDGSQLTLHLQRPAGNPAPANLSATLAAFCHALVLSTEPTGEKPLTLQVHVHQDLLPELKPFAESPDWKVSEARKGGNRVFTCLFAWDAEELSLTRGSVPLGELIFNPDRPWSVIFDSPDHNAADPDPGNLPGENPEQ